MKKTKRIFFILLISCILSLRYTEMVCALESNDLTQLSLEELMNVPVTSVSKKTQNISDAAAAVYVITQEDIRQSGCTSIPELLRMAPGLEVARIDSNKWAVTSRGHNDRFANKLLVLIDGRTVYTPLFSGVFWDIQDLMLEDIERIEVIRGPGASLWGANAVNGVINIITKKAKDTQGGLLSASMGTEDRVISSARYGGRMGDDAYYRVYAKYFNRDRFVDFSGDTAADQWDEVHGGYRVDWDISDKDSLTIQGDFYTGTIHSTEEIPIMPAPYWQRYYDIGTVTGGNILSRWTRQLSDSSEYILQLYYDHDDRDTFLFNEKRDTVDVDFQHRFVLNSWNEIIYGAGYRFTIDQSDETALIFFSTPSRADHLFSTFLQDEMSFWDDALKLTVGTKIEHNDYTGFEFQPSARVIWTPHEKHRIWASYSRSVRTPSRSEHDVRYELGYVTSDDPRNFLGLPALAIIEGDPGFDSEILQAFEVGYRYFASDFLTLDVASFYNDYSKLRTGELGDISVLSTSPFILGVPIFADNRMTGETYGIELSAESKLSDWWRIKTAYTALQIQLHLAPDSFGLGVKNAEGMSPHHQVSILSDMALSKHFDLDLWFRYVDELSGLHVPAYTTLDILFRWKPSDKLDLSWGIQGALDSPRREFDQTNYFYSIPTETQRNIFFKVTWRF